MAVNVLSGLEMHILVFWYMTDSGVRKNKYFYLVL